MTGFSVYLAYVKALCWINQVCVHFVSVSNCKTVLLLVWVYVSYHFVTMQRHLWLPELIVRDFKLHQYFMLIMRFFLILLSRQAGAQLALNISSLSTEWHFECPKMMTKCTPVVILHTVLISPEIKVRLSQLHKENVCLKSQVTRLRAKINDAVNNDVDPDLMMI